MAAAGSWSGCDDGLVRICDPAGRPMGAGFVADRLGTVLTSHEAVDGLARLVLHAPGERTCVVVAADDVVPLPAAGLALVRSQGLRVRPLPVAARGTVETGAYVRIAARGWRQARVLARGSRVTYPAKDRVHPLPAALELAVGTEGREALRPGGGAAGGPVVDPATGAVLAVLGTALLPAAVGSPGGGDGPVEHRAAGFAVPLRQVAAADPDGPLAALLARNATTVPAYGDDLNVAAVLQLTATSVGSEGPRDEGPVVERPEVEREFEAFLADRGAAAAAVLGLVGPPGSGRSTELAALARRRATSAEPAPTVWLRGAGLRAGDMSVADAVQRALDDAGRIVAAALDEGRGAGGAGLGDISPDRVARLVRDAGRPLLVLLDCPEEMPPGLAHRLAEWTAGTAEWLRGTGARLVVACRGEYWEQAGRLFPAGTRYVPGGRGHASGTGSGRLPACVRLGALDARQAARARARYGIPDDAVAPGDAGHPLALRLLSEVRAGLSWAPEGRPARAEIFAVYLDLMCLRIAVRVGAAQGLRGTAVRRLAAYVSGRVHEAARRSLGPGQGELDRASFEAVFPWATGYASAVLAEGLLVPAGGGYRFAHEELADWIQGGHLDLDTALHALVHHWRGAGAAVAAAHVADGPGPVAVVTAAGPGVPVQAIVGRGLPPGRGVVRADLEPVREVLDVTEADAPPRGRTGAGPGPAAPLDHSPAGAGSAGPLPVPRHRIGPVVEALLLLGRQQGSGELAARLEELAQGADHFAGRVADRRSADAAWWAVRLLSGVLSRVPDARPYLGVLRLLVERIARCGRDGSLRGRYEAFGPGFWRGLPLPEAERMELLRRLVVADPGPGEEGGERFLDAVGEWLKEAPGAVQPLLTRWFTDERALAAAPDATVARAAQALLYTHRHRAVDDLTEALVDRAHARGDELLGALAEEEPSALCRAVDRWAHDIRPDRQVAAARWGLRTAPHVRTDADRGLLRYAALALLARPADCASHGAALALLVRDPQTRSRHLPLALRRFAAGDPQLPPSALAAALGTYPEPVLAAFRARLRAPGPVSDELLRALADGTTPALARRVAGLVQEFLELRPEAAPAAARYIDRRLDQGPAARAILFPLVCGVLRSRHPQVRRAVAAVLVAPGTRASRPLRAELLDVLAGQERDPAVLAALRGTLPDTRAR